MRNKIWRIFAYYRRGSAIMSHFLQAVDKALTIAIFFVLIAIDWVVAVAFGSLVMFVFSVWCVYVGRWDYVYGSFKQQARIEFGNNPEWNEKWDNIEATLEKQGESILKLSHVLIELLEKLKQ